MKHRFWRVHINLCNFARWIGYFISIAHQISFHSMKRSEGVSSRHTPATTVKTSFSQIGSNFSSVASPWQHVAINTCDTSCCFKVFIWRTWNVGNIPHRKNRRAEEKKCTCIDLTISPNRKRVRKCHEVEPQSLKTDSRQTITPLICCIHYSSV